MEGEEEDVHAFPLAEKGKAKERESDMPQEDEHGLVVAKRKSFSSLRGMKSRFDEWAEGGGKPALLLASRILWMVVFSGLAASIQFWIPSLYAPNSSHKGINVTVLLFNLIGCFIISICTAFKQVKFQYMQSYLMYDGLRAGFCSTFTTFGNLIEDTGRLILSGMWWLSFINLFATFILSFCVWEAGRFVARRWKGGVAYSKIEQVLENADQRMEYEVEKMLLSQDSPGIMQSNVFFSGSSKPLYKISHHIQKQQVKSKRHLHRWWLLRRHYVILLLIAFPPLVNYIIVTTPLAYAVTQLLDYPSRAALVFDWTCMHMLSVAGVCVGLAVDSFTTSTRHSVQWGTFKNNIVSCILIGAAHSLLLFRHYFPFGGSYYFSTLTSRFITSFCGSESSFAGLVDETAVLFHARVQKWTWVRNIGYNLFLCTLVFLVVIFAVRFSVFFHYFGPETAKLYICGVFNQC